jgi:DNA topoisomerase-3
VFLPDCKFSTTTVLGEVKGDETVEFKVTGKEILDPGWRIIQGKVQKEDEGDDKKAPDDEGLRVGELDSGMERTLPTFVKGESGDHKPTLTEKWTTPPAYYNEASLLRAMETAGKFVEDETLRAAMKENGIGRPSSRAGIIETLFKRHYIKRERKRLIATPTGIELIDLIREELLKSCELTGIWEKKLRDIEHQKYDAQQFIEELKQQVTEIVNEVMTDSTNRRVTVLTDADLKKVKSPKAESAPKAKTTRKTKATAPPKQADTATGVKEGDVCPVCGQGHIIKGKTAYGCSRWKEGCTFRAPLGDK